MENRNREELVYILTKFAGSGWDLIAEPSKAWLDETEIQKNYSQPLNRLTKIVEVVDVNMIRYIKAIELLKHRNLVASHLLSPIITNATSMRTLDLLINFI